MWTFEIKFPRTYTENSLYLSILFWNQVKTYLEKVLIFIFCRTLQLKIDLKLETKETYTVCGKLYGKGEPGKLFIWKKHPKCYLVQLKVLVNVSGFP